MSRDGRLAVVLFNLGGPDSLDAVRPFLESLFADPAIIGAPRLIRLPLAAIISRARERVARRNYALMGGSSPLLTQTNSQAAALERELTRRRRGEVKVFVAMRHGRPKAAETATAVEAFAPDQLVLTPLYPQFSTTTTASSMADWRRNFHGVVKTSAICCWCQNAGLVEAHADIICSTWEDAGRPAVRLLFSAHGLPDRIVQRGDPYQWQIEATCAAVAQRLGSEWQWRVCYQSRIGPSRWLGPSTREEIIAAARDGIGVLIDPIAFVSEHVETLVELDCDYRRVAEAVGVRVFLRCPTVQEHPALIAGLADAVERSASVGGVSPDGPRCPGTFVGCGAYVQ
jgi:ferrochelatase